MFIFNIKVSILTLKLKAHKQMCIGSILFVKQTNKHKTKPNLTNPNKSPKA